MKNVRSTFGLSMLKAERKSIPTNDMKNVRSTCGLSKLRITNFAESSRYSAMATGLP